MEDGEEEKFGRASSPWRWETESMTAGEGEDSCVFLMAQANVWVLSVLNEYLVFSSCEFLNNTFPPWQFLDRKVAFPWVSIKEWQSECFLEERKKWNDKLSWAVESQWFSLVLSNITSWQHRVPSSLSGLWHRNTEQNNRLMQLSYIILSCMGCN